MFCSSLFGYKLQGTPQGRNPIETTIQTYRKSTIFLVYCMIIVMRSIKQQQITAATEKIQQVVVLVARCCVIVDTLVILAYSKHKIQSRLTIPKETIPTCVIDVS
jgi:hypothetical protein